MSSKRQDVFRGSIPRIFVITGLIFIFSQSVSAQSLLENSVLQLSPSAVANIFGFSIGPPGLRFSHAKVFYDDSVLLRDRQIFTASMVLDKLAFSGIVLGKETCCMYRMIYFFILPALFVVGCASKCAFLRQDFATEPVAIRVNAVAINVADQRKNITDRKLKIPSISFPGQHDQIEPQLAESQIQLVKSEVQKYFVGGAKDVIVNVNISQGSQAFAASLLNEKEAVEFEVSIDLLDAGSQQLLVSGVGNATYQIKSWDASQGYINKLFEKAIRASIYKCMEKISTAMPFPPGSKIQRVYAFIAYFQPDLVVGLQRDGEWYLPGGILEGKKDSAGVSGTGSSVFSELASYIKQQTGLTLTSLSKGLQIMMRQVEDGAELIVLYAGRATGDLSGGARLAVEALPNFAPVCGEPEKLIRELVKGR